MNRNKSYISKESIERAIPTMYNCPIVCHYDVAADSIGGHDIDVVRMDNGSVQMINLTDAVGVVPLDAEYWWEDIDDDGQTHQYFNIRVIIWKRSAVYEKLVRDGITSQSMEITVNDGAMKDGVFNIEDFTFTAFCLLGDDIEPCFESAAVTMYDRDIASAHFVQMMKEWKESFSKEDITKGGTAMDEKRDLLAEFGVTEEQLDFGMDELSLDELRAKLTERRDAAKFALVNQMIEEIYASLSTQVIETEYGKMQKYWYWDYDDESMEIYCHDSEDWNLYGFGYSMNGDHVVIDFDSKKRKKLAVADFDEGTTPANFAKVVAAVAEAATAKESARMDEQFQVERTGLEEKYAAVEQTVETMQAELEDLRKFKLDTTVAARAAEEEAVFSMFPDLAGNEAFEALKEDCAKFSIEDLEEKCYAIRGRADKRNFSMQKQPAPRLAVTHGGAPGRGDEPYGGLFVEFPPNI